MVSSCKSKDLKKVYGSLNGTRTKSPRSEVPAVGDLVGVQVVEVHWHAAEFVPGPVDADAMWLHGSKVFKPDQVCKGQLAFIRAEISLVVQRNLQRTPPAVAQLPVSPPLPVR